MVGLAVILLAFVGAVAVAVAVRRRSAAWAFEPRCVAVQLPLAFFLLVVLFVIVIAKMPALDWNACRLAPSVALRYGYRLYYGPSDGPILNTLYGPVVALVFLPAALASHPTVAVWIAGAINGLLLILPLVLLFRSECSGRDPEQKVIALTCLVFAIALLPMFQSTCSTMTWIHADAPAVGLGLLACMAAMRSVAKPSWRNLLTCAAWSVLACYAKQIEAPLVMGLALYVGLAVSFAAAVRFLACAAAAGAAFGLLFGALFGPSEMLFNLFTLPGNHPWLYKGLSGWVGTLVRLIVYGLAVGLVVLFRAIVTLRSTRRSGAGLRAWLRDENWTVLAMAALFLIPTSLIARMKVGGFVNSFHSIYYAIACAAIVINRWAREARNDARRVSVVACYFAAAVVLGLSLASQWDGLDCLRKARYPLDEAYEFAREHPGEAYFPWHPLATLLAEGKLYHFEYGVVDREMAGFPPTAAHCRAFLPAHIKYVVYERDRWKRSMLKYLPEYSRASDVRALADLDRPAKEAVADPTLPMWSVYRRDTHD